MTKYLLAGLLLACSAITPAAALTFTFNVTGSFDGKIHDFDGDNQLVTTEFEGRQFSLTGRLSTIPTIGAEFIDLDSFTALSDGVNYIASSPSVLASLDDNGFIFGGIESAYLGFTFADGPLFVIGTPVPVNYYFDFPFGYSLATDKGEIGFTSGTDLAFTIGVEGLNVPEPASWSLMALGFGLVGAGLRRRNRDAVAA